jgi:hypothetical protein
MAMPHIRRFAVCSSSPSRVPRVNVSASAGLLIAAPALEVEVRALPHLAVYAQGEANLWLDGAGAQVGLRGSWNSFDGVFIDAHFRYSHFERWYAGNSSTYDEAFNPGVAVGYSKIFKSGFSLSGGVGVNFLGVTTTPHYVATTAGGCSEYAGCGLEVLVRLFEVAGGSSQGRRVERYDHAVGPALELRMMVGYAF